MKKTRLHRPTHGRLPAVVNGKRACMACRKPIKKGKRCRDCARAKRAYQQERPTGVGGTSPRPA